MGRGPGKRPAEAVTTFLPSFPEAACKDRPDLPWTSDEQHGPRVREMARVCSRCRHVAPCAAFAIAHPDLVGVWGGLTADERTEERFYRRGVTS